MSKQISVLCPLGAAPLMFVLADDAVCGEALATAMSRALSGSEPDPLVFLVLGVEAVLQFVDGTWMPLIQPAEPAIP